MRHELPVEGRANVERARPSGQRDTGYFYRSPAVPQVGGSVPQGLRGPRRGCGSAELPQDIPPKQKSVHCGRSGDYTGDPRADP